MILCKIILENGLICLYIIHIEFYTIFNYNLIYHIMSIKYNYSFEVNQKINSSYQIVNTIVFRSVNVIVKVWVTHIKKCRSGSISSSLLL